MAVTKPREEPHLEDEAEMDQQNLHVTNILPRSSFTGQFLKNQPVIIGSNQDSIENENQDATQPAAYPERPTRKSHNRKSLNTMGGLRFRP